MVYWVRQLWLVSDGPIWDWGRRRREGKSQEARKVEARKVEASTWGWGAIHASCCPGSDPGPCPLSQLPFCSQSP